MASKFEKQDSFKTITMMTFNLRFGLADDGQNSWENRKHAYPELFHEISPDFIGVQEANNFQSQFLDHLLEEYNYIGMRDPSPEFWQNNLIFYKKSWSCLKSNHYFLSETPTVESKHPESKWPRQCTIGLFERNHHKLIHINTHFDFKESVQQRSAEILIEFLSEFPQNIPVVLTGDFNASPDSQSYKTFISHGFHDVFNGKHSSTFHGFTGSDIGEHIDWILYKGDMVARERMIVRKQFAGIYPSDHFPVTATFELN